MTNSGAVAGVRPAFALPTEAIPASRVWVQQKFLMLGQAGIGKSEFWAQDPGAFFVDAEWNLNHLAVKRLPCRSWEDLREILTLLYQAHQAGTFPYTTLVFDTYDRLVNYANEEVVSLARRKFAKAAENIHTIGDVPEGVGWDMRKNLVMGMLQKIEQFPCAKVIIAHANNKEIKEPTRVIHKDTINIGGQLGTDTLAWANHILHIRASLQGTTLQRKVYALPSETIEAKSHGGAVPDKWEWSLSSTENFGKLKGLFT